MTVFRSFARSLISLKIMILDDARNLAIILGTVVSVITLVKGVFEYIRQNTQKRFEYYISMRERYKQKDRFQELFELLENNDPKLAHLPYHKKQDLLGFYEDIALMVNSGILTKSVAHYMFAYYAIKCWESDKFWKNLNRDCVYWKLFRDFVDQMKEVEKSLTENSHFIKQFKI